MSSLLKGTRRHWHSLAAAAALLALATLYFALGNAIVSTNDGSPYPPTKALVVDRTARIDTYVGYAAIQPRWAAPRRASRAGAE